MHTPRLRNSRIWHWICYTDEDGSTWYRWRAHDGSWGIWASVHGTARDADSCWGRDCTSAERDAARTG